jgi:hypothetical protein
VDDAQNTVFVPIDESPGVVGTFQILRRWWRDSTSMEATMGVGKGALLWLLGIPLPIIILLVLFWR